MHVESAFLSRSLLPMIANNNWLPSCPGHDKLLLVAIMGRRERERKANRALAELGQTATPSKAAALVPKTPVAKRPASVRKASSSELGEPAR